MAPGVRARALARPPAGGGGRPRRCASTSPTPGLDPRIPLRSPAGPLLVPLDRPALELVWHPDGYPARPPYRDTHALTEYHHQAWAVDGGPYEPARAAAQAVADAREFVAAVAARVAAGGLCVVALDTELLGTHWHEGPQWLRAVLVAAEEAGLPVCAARRGADRPSSRRRRRPCPSPRGARRAT